MTTAVVTAVAVPVQQGDVDESEASGSYGESGQWGGAIQGNHEAVAMDMAMLG